MRIKTLTRVAIVLYTGKEPLKINRFGINEKFEPNNLYIMDNRAYHALKRTYGDVFEAVEENDITCNIKAKVVNETPTPAPQETKEASPQLDIDNMKRNELFKLVKELGIKVRGNIKNDELRKLLKEKLGQ